MIDCWQWIYWYTEPGNGSDAGAASTTASDGGDHWILNGSKAWITNSKEAAYGLVLATTDKSLKHKGISCFIVDMDTPGVTIGKSTNLKAWLSQLTSNLVLIHFLKPN